MSEISHLHERIKILCDVCYEQAVAQGRRALPKNHESSHWGGSLMLCSAHITFSPKKLPIDLLITRAHWSHGTCLVLEKSYFCGIWFFPLVSWYIWGQPHHWDDVNCLLLCFGYQWPEMKSQQTGIQTLVSLSTWVHRLLELLKWLNSLAEGSIVNVISEKKTTCFALFKAFGKLQLSIAVLMGLLNIIKDS